MKLKVLSETQNPLLKRKEVKVEIVHNSQGTPNRTTAKQELAGYLGYDAQKMQIIAMKTLTGTRKTICDIELYEEVERGERIVHQHILERGLPKKTEQEKVEPPPKVAPPKKEEVKKTEQEKEQEKPQPDKQEEQK